MPPIVKDKPKPLQNMPMEYIQAYVWLLEEIALAASRALVAFLAISKFVAAGSGFNNRITIPIIKTTTPTGNNIFLLILRPSLNIIRNGIYH